MSISKAKILLVDDHQIVLDSLSLLLSSFPHIEVVATFTDGNHAIEFLETNPVDLLISDLRMPIMSGIELCELARKINPKIKLLVLTMIEDAKNVRAAVKLGVDGYLLKMTDADELLHAITTVLEGKKYFSDEVIIELALNKEDSNNYKNTTRLTIREVEILKLVGKEMSTNEIADKLFISVPTVETHRRNMMQKIGAKSVVGLVLFAAKNDLLD